MDGQRGPPVNQRQGARQPFAYVGEQLTGWARGVVAAQPVDPTRQQLNRGR